MKRIPNNVQNAIISLLKEGISTCEVCKKYSASHSSIQRIRKKYYDDIPKLSAGRPKILSAQDKRSLVRFVSSGVAKSAVMAGKLLENVNVRCSRWTVRRALREMNFKAIEKKDKPMLSKKNIKARLAFAKRYIHWSVDDWKRVIWSDESKINRFLSDGRQWAWIRKGESLQKRHVNETVKFGDGSIMLWGCFTAYGVGSLNRIKGRMNQYMYKEILDVNLCETIGNMPINERNVVFRHDRDPKHMAKSVQKWLELQPFQLLDWPAQSPDLNPIKNLWAILKKQLHDEYDSPPRNLDELWDRSEEQWHAIPPEICTNLVESMPRRIAAVLSAKSLWTKY